MIKKIIGTLLIVVFFINCYGENNLSELDKKIISPYDKDGDGKDDISDILEGARKEVENKTYYESNYYRGGYPPEGEGVCTDVIWRAYKNAGYNLKDLVDKDIKANKKDYTRIKKRADPNIDFRRVLNLIPFFIKNSPQLTKEVIEGDLENLKQWQAGDIVVFGSPLNHIAVISDKRNKKGVPYIIHNAAPYASEEDYLLKWHKNVSKIVYHFRPKLK